MFDIIERALQREEEEEDSRSVIVSVFYEKIKSQVSVYITRQIRVLLSKKSYFILFLFSICFWYFLCFFWRYLGFFFFYPHLNVNKHYNNFIREENYYKFNKGVRF